MDIFKASLATTRALCDPLVKDIIHRVISFRVIIIGLLVRAPDE
jgi:hypothetical protein